MSETLFRFLLVNPPLRVPRVPCDRAVAAACLGQSPFPAKGIPPGAPPAAAPLESPAVFFEDGATLATRADTRFTGEVGRHAGAAGVRLAACLSGASGLVAETVWSRYLHLIFGVSAYAVAVLLACFMAGLALGGWHLGRAADRSRVGPRKLLVVIELSLAGYVVASPSLYAGLMSLAASAGGSGGGADTGARVIRVTGSVLVLLTPTYLMGGTAPVFLKLLTPAADRAGRETATYYAINTFGAAAGAFASGFVLMGMIGLRGSLVVAAVMNVAAAALVWRTGTRGVETASPVGSASAPASEESVKVDRGRPRQSRIAGRGRASTSARPPARPGPVLLAFGVTGFVGMAYEVAFTRLLTFFFRDSVYDFAVVLTAFLCGTAVGSVAAGVTIRRLRAPLVTQLAVVLALAGFCGLASLAVAGRYPYWLNDLQTNTSLAASYGGAYWTAGTLARFGYTFVLLLVPAGLCGAAFPLAAGIVVDDLPGLGRRVGLLAAVNAVGAAAGAVAAGVVVANLFGLRAAIILPALLGVATAVTLLRSSSMRVGVIAAAAALTTATLPAWDRLRMSTSFLDPNQRLEALLSLKFYREDAYGITSVVELVPLRRKYLVTNRLYAQNNSDMMGPEDHRRLGHIPMLIHPAPRSVLAVGLGAGVTLRGINDLKPDRLDCVEIAPAVIEASAQFGDENGHVTRRPNVRLIPKDGRNYLAGTAARYDVIVLDILHPMSSGSSTVFSREYYALCRSRLNDGGLVCQWLPAHQLAWPQIRTVVATFRTVFPHASLWYGMIGESPAVGVVGTSGPLAVDAGRLANAYAAPDVAAELAEVNLGTPELLLSHFIAGEDALRRLAEGAAVDTDDRPVIEFAAPKIAVQSRRLGVGNLVEMARLATGTAAVVNGTINGPALDGYIKGKRKLVAGLAAAVLDGRDTERDRIYREALADDPENADLRYAWRAANGPP